MWSDGRSLPEVVLDAYQKAGYDFVCLSDHNIFQDNPDFWLPVQNEFKDWPPEFTYEEFNRTKQLLPGVMEEKVVGIRTMVRLKPFEELKKMFHKPGKFLVIPGEEITIMGANLEQENRRYEFHFNIFNIAKNFPVTRIGSGEHLFQTVLDNYNAEKKDDTFIMLNHPFWRVWDVDPRLLIQFSEIKFFEICNSGTKDMPDGWIADREQYWDFILAHRIVNGKGVLYGTASDDAHFYGSAEPSSPGDLGTGFVMVDCPDEFDTSAITKAMFQGDFYASAGVLLEDVVFCKETGTLEIKVKPEDGVTYRIDFITTKKDFDQSIEIKEFPMTEKEIHSRIFPVIREDIGRTVLSVSGTSASYTLQDDDLYVRALITADKPSFYDCPFYPKFKSAWSQPFTK
jgi:hypothetical protein